MAERIFTKDVGEHFKKGDKRDYPAGTWETISRNLKKPLDSFSKTPDELIGGGSSNKSVRKSAPY